MKSFVISTTFAAAFFALTSLSGLGQTPGASPTPQDNDVVKITTKLVQLDVVVTDKDGNQITDLTADEFEILQDGKPQDITGVTYVGTTPVAPAVRSTSSEKKNKIPPPPVKTRVSANSRIITFVVDDGNCAASLSGMIASRDGVQKFINEQMLPTDLVAIYRTRAGSSMLQQYTSDKAQLLRAASKIHWCPAMGTCGSRDGSFNEAARVNTIEAPGRTIVVENVPNRQLREHVEDTVRNNQIVGSLGVLRFVVRGLQSVPGRKVLFFISDGMPVRSRDGQLLSAVYLLRNVTDLANRSSVVINAVHNRGLGVPGMLEARDEVSVRDDARGADYISEQRVDQEFNEKGGLAFLAGETGGDFYENQNFLEKPIRKALVREQGYYLVAYEPAEGTFKGKGFNNVKIKVSRPDLKIASRSGFLPATNESVKPKRRSENSELYEAIISPLPKPGLSVYLSAYFVNTAGANNVVRSMFHLDGKEITFVDSPDGLKKAVLDVVAVTLNEKNEVIDEFARTHNFRVPASAIPAILKNGIDYTTDVPVKKPGTYNFRVAVRDATSKSLGSAVQIVQIPDLKGSLLVLGGLTMSGIDREGNFIVPGAVDKDNSIWVPASSATPAVRKFSKGSYAAYSYTIYNATLDPATGKPIVTIQVNLFRDGKMVFEGKPLPADFEPQKDWSRINDYGRFKLAPTSAPGDYALQLIVKDLLADEKKAVTSGWVDFEISD